jgi:biotin synthase
MSALSFQELAAASLAGEALSRRQCGLVLGCADEDILALLDAAWRVRRRHFGTRVHVQVLSNAKSGLCPEDCRYCSQSSVSTADIDRYPMISPEELLAGALGAKAAGARRFCMAISGSAPSEAELDRLCEALGRIKAAAAGLSLCGSLGFLSVDQARRLKRAGLDRVNHNLNTSEGYYGQICTTHGYRDRLDTIANCQAGGLEICSGGIVGQGESDEDVIDMLLALRAIGPQAVPINFLVPIAGTPFAHRAGDLNPRKCLKVLCLARLLLPAAEIRASAGREHHLRSLQPLALYAAVSIFVSGYLTTGGQSAEAAREMIRDLGFEIVTE